MRPARTLMNLGRATALAAGPRRRGADREAWNRSRRTLLRAQEAADRTGTSLGEETVKLEAMMNARAGTEQERERGINAPPFSYEPGETPATARPDSYFVNDPARQATVRAKELAAGGYDPARQARANRAYRDQMATVSRGTGLAPAGEGVQGVPLKRGATYAINPVQPGMSFTGPAGGSQIVPGAAATEVPEERAAWGQPGLEGLGEGMGYARLRGTYPTQEAAAAQAQAQGVARQQQIASPYGQEAETALRAQTGPGMARARALKLAPPVQGIEDIATEQAIQAAQQAEAAQAQAAAEAGAGLAPRAMEAEVAGAEAGVRLAGAQATVAENLAKFQTSDAYIASLVRQQGQEAAGQWTAIAEMFAASGDVEGAQMAQQAAIAAMGFRPIYEEMPENVFAFLYRKLAGLFSGGAAGQPPQKVVGYEPAPMPAAPVAGAGPIAGAQAGAGQPIAAGTGLPDIDERNLTPEQRAAIKQWAATL